MSALITSEQELSLTRVTEDGVRKAIKVLKDEGVLTVEAAQRALGRGDELQSTIFDKLRELTQGRYANEEVTSKFTYPPEYTGPKSVEEQLEILLGLQFPMNRVPSVEIACLEPAEGLFVVSRPEVIAPSDCDQPYRYATEFVFERLTSQQSFVNYRAVQLGPEYLRQPEHTVQMLRQLGESQQGDVFVLPAQFGLRHRGRSVRRAREVLLANEVGLGAFTVGCMLLTHPEREVRWEQLHTDCDDEFSPDADGQFSKAPCFYFGDGKLWFSTYFTDNARGHYGLVSAFLPQ